eukprot:7181328-Alexandrium_andersonii.AAC.1
MLGESTHPYAKDVARASEEDCQAALKDYGYFERPVSAAEAEVDWPSPERVGETFRGYTAVYGDYGPSGL